MKFKKIALLLITVMTFFSGCSDNEIDIKTIEVPVSTGDFEFSVLKVGQADAIVLKSQNNCVVIDCGEEDDGDDVVEYINNNNIEKIDYMFITHFDKDHVGGVPEVLDNIETGKIITPDYEGNNAEFESFKNALKDNEIETVRLNEKMTFVLNDLLVEVYPPLKKSYAEGDNDYSLAISITHGKNKYLFAGDAEEARLSELLVQTREKYNFLKVPHHGRYNEFSKRFFETLKPEYSVISCSEKNPPEDKTVEVLENLGSKVYFTKDGDINVTCNGEEIDIRQ